LARGQDRCLDRAARLRQRRGRVGYRPPAARAGSAGLPVRRRHLSPGRPAAHRRRRPHVGGSAAGDRTLTGLELNLKSRRLGGRASQDQSGSIVYSRCCNRWRRGGGRTESHRGILIPNSWQDLGSKPFEPPTTPGVLTPDPTPHRARARQPGSIGHRPAACRSLWRLPRDATLLKGGTHPLGCRTAPRSAPHC